VKVENAVQLTLSTVAGNCAITAGGGTDYAVDFGTLNGLGIASTSGGTTCASAPTVTATDATYTTQYQVTPKYSGFSNAGAHINITAPAFATVASLTLKEGPTAGPLVAVPVSGTTDQIVVASSGTPITRMLGITVANTNGAGTLTGSDSTTVTFTMTIP